MFLLRLLSLALLFAAGVLVSAMRGLIPGLPPSNAVAQVASAVSQTSLDCTLPACIAMMQPSGFTSETVADATSCSKYSNYLSILQYLIVATQLPRPPQARHTTLSL